MIMKKLSVISYQLPVKRGPVPQCIFAFLRSKSKALPWQKSTAGFTLVELLVASTMIITVFSGILALVNYSIYAMVFIRDNLIASFLAQEGIELVIKKRGENWISGDSFNEGLTGTVYRVDYLDGFEELDEEEDQEPLKFHASLGYQYNSGQETNFFRTIGVSEISRDHLRINSVVRWESRNKTFQVIVEDHLYNWFGVEAE